MKLFINDWGGSSDNFTMNTEENKEYRINSWITAGNGKQVYLVSAYVYDEFVMFFYMYDLSYHPEYEEQHAFKIPKTNRESMEDSKKYRERFNVLFEYDVNHLTHRSGRSGTCLPRQLWESGPGLEQEPEQDEWINMLNDEYEYLYNLMEKTGRIPEALQNKKLAFKKDCSSFEETVNEIKDFAIYRSNHNFCRQYVEKTFTVPYGACNLKVPYTVSDTGEESYIIIKELKFQNMLESFDEHYDVFKEAHEKSLRDYEENKEKHGENSSIMSLEESRAVFDETILILSLLKPEERRTFEMYTKDYLDSEIKTSCSDSVISKLYFFSEDEDKMEGELYKWTTSLGEVAGEPKDEYEITFVSFTDSTPIERKALFERNIKQIGIK